MFHVHLIGKCILHNMHLRFNIYLSHLMNLLQSPTQLLFHYLLELPKVKKNVVKSFSIDLPIVFFPVLCLCIMKVISMCGFEKSTLDVND